MAPEIRSYFDGANSTLRRNKIPNIPEFCETRWTTKYKSFRKCCENFLTIVRVLEELSRAKLEPMCNQLQEVNMNIKAIHDTIT
jgi:hypothetical protein